MPKHSDVKESVLTALTKLQNLEKDNLGVPARELAELFRVHKNLHWSLAAILQHFRDCREKVGVQHG